MQKLLQNWKTTSAGALMIIGATAHLIFNRPITEEGVMVAATAIIGGLGLIFAGDASQSHQLPAKPAEDKPTDQTKV